jgi:hypothetical protein
LFIENLFSTYLYTGNGSTQTITNGINLSANAGLVWLKGRNIGSNNVFLDTIRGVNSSISSNNTDGAINPAGGYVSAFNTTGFSLGSNITANGSTYTYASWTFREQPKFFDVLTYTGTGAVQNIAHNLGSAPGCIIVKKISGDGDDWGVYHRSPGATYKLNLNNGSAAALSTGYWNNTEPTSTVFTVATSGITNQSGATYIAYLFAHDAGGFGVSGSENVISCGSFNTDGSGNASVTLGYEPQWILTKQSNATNSWGIYDTMRGWAYTNQNYLLPDSSGVEGEINAANFVPNATGFTTSSPFATSATYIYIAIRRGPMAVPTVGTTVFQPAYGTGGTPGYVSSFTVDSLINMLRAGVTGNPNLASRLTGTNYITTSGTDGSSDGSGFWKWDFQTGCNTSTFGSTYLGEMFKRAPSFFDVVGYRGTNSGGLTQTIPHNLGVAPELTIFKKRATASNWTVAMPAIGGNAVSLNLNDVGANSNIQFVDTYGASSITTASGYDTISENTTRYVAYLFATCPGVSKVGSYTGTGALLTVNCGFTTGARFVLIKRIDSTGDWFTFDSAQGLTGGNDPYFLMNSAAAQVNGTNYVDTTAVGFQVTAAAPAGLNASGGTYIFLAIA